MVVWSEESYWLVRFLFQRSLAAIYLVAFLVAANQFRPLAGEDGILPLQRFTDNWDFTERPSLFHYYPSDRAIGIAAWSGVGLSLLALVGLPYVLPAGLAVPVSMLLWFLLWALYLSFVNAGQLFYGYGWESMLCETGAIAIFLGDGTTATPIVTIWLLRWLLFRNMFGAGLIKLRGDQCWRDLTCMDYHYETQPIPNPVSWFAHHLPDRVHRGETFGNHVVELIVPFLYFAPQPFAAIGGILTIGFQGWLVLTGNFSWLNWLTIVLGIAAFGDSILTTLLPGAATVIPQTTAAPIYLQAAAILYAGYVAYRSIAPVRNMLSRMQVMNTSFDPLNLVNTYGAFGSITRERYELVVEGTQDQVVTEDTEWRTYEFKGKPTDPSRRPTQIAPYHLRIDWQFWFAAMSPSPRRSPWIGRFVQKLLEGDDATIALLANDPFPDEPPTHVRIRRFRYRYTTTEERKQTGDWWHREFTGDYVRPVTLDDMGGRRAGGPRRRV